MVRMRNMPATTWEMFYPRWVFLLALPINGALAAFATLAALTGFAGDGDWSASTQVLVALIAVWWWWLCVNLCVMVIYRPRHTYDRLMEINSQRGGGILIPGSRRLVATSFVGALLTLLLLVAIMVAVDGVWVIVVGVLAAGMLLVVIDFALTVTRPRFLLLTPQGVSVSVYRTQATVAWDDIVGINYVQGMNGAMVISLRLLPGVAPLDLRWRHPFSVRKGTYDIEPIALDLDPLLLMLALRHYWMYSYSRQELAGSPVPTRLTDPAVALAAESASASSTLLGLFKTEQEPLR